MGRTMRLNLNTVEITFLVKCNVILIHLHVKGFF